MVQVFPTADEHADPEGNRQLAWLGILLIFSLCCFAVRSARRLPRCEWSRGSWSHTSGTAASVYAGDSMNLDRDAGAPPKKVPHSGKGRKQMTLYRKGHPPVHRLLSPTLFIHSSPHQPHPPPTPPTTTSPPASTTRKFSQAIPHIRHNGLCESAQCCKPPFWPPNMS